jgi:hypothetical protein
LRLNLQLTQTNRKTIAERKICRPKTPGKFSN